MEIIIKGTPKETADLVRAVQGRAEPMKREEFKKLYQDYQKSNDDKHLKLPTDSS